MGKPDREKKSEKRSIKKNEEGMLKTKNLRCRRAER